MYYLRSKPSVNPVKFTVAGKASTRVKKTMDDSESVRSEESLGFHSSQIRKDSSASSTENKENAKDLPILSARHILGLKQELVVNGADEDDSEGCVMCSS